jgi:hypothetical protein
MIRTKEGNVFHRLPRTFDINCRSDNTTYMITFLTPTLTHFVVFILEREGIPYHTPWSNVHRRRRQAFCHSTPNNVLIFDSHDGRQKV